MKRIIAIVLAAIIAVSTMAVTAFADTTPVTFSITLTAGSTADVPNSGSKRQKSTDSSVYVNYNGLGGTSCPKYFYAYIYAAKTSTGRLIDVSTYTSSGTARPMPRVELGTQGTLKNLAYETFNGSCYVQLYGHVYSNYGGIARGDWSADIGSNTYPSYN